MDDAEINARRKLTRIMEREGKRGRTDPRYLEMLIAEERAAEGMEEITLLYVNLAKEKAPEGAMALTAI